MIDSDSEEYKNLKEKANQEAIIGYNGLPAEVRAVIRHIPLIGGDIDYILGAKGQRYFKERVEYLFSSLDIEIKQVNESKIDKNFLASEDFFEILRSCIENAVRTKSREKIASYARIIRNSLTHEVEVGISPQGILEILSDLSEEQAVVLGSINLLLNTGEDKIINYGESLKQFLPNQYYDRLQYCLKRLEGYGLLIEQSGALLSYSGGTFYLTDTGRALLKYIYSEM